MEHRRGFPSPRHRGKGDRILGAAVLSRLDPLPAKSRPFKAAEFAEAVSHNGGIYHDDHEALEALHLVAQALVTSP